MPTSRLEIDLSAIDRNLAVVRSVLTPPTAPTRDGDNAAEASPRRIANPGVCAVVKQDGYGLGAPRICKRLAALGVEMLSVYSLDEARTLAEAVPTTPILVLMPVPGVDRMDPLYRHVTAGRVHLTLHSPDQLRSLFECAARIGAPLPVHVQVDTGMCRGGASAESARSLVESVLASNRMRLAGLMTHFASPCCDDAFTRTQARAFRDFVETVKPAIKAYRQSHPRGAGDVALHAANSCAVFRSRSLHASMVRIGQGLLGFALDDAEARAGFEFAEAAERLEPAVRWTTTVVHTAEIPAGSPVGYGSTWRAPKRENNRPTRVALIPVGYADGYPRSLGGRSAGGRGIVGFTGRVWEKTVRTAGPEDSIGPTIFAPVVGRVSMDQITVDVSDVPERYLRPSGRTGEAAQPEVEMYSRTRTDRNYLPAMAAAAGSITHELLTRISPRVERVYTYPVTITPQAEPAARARAVGV